MSCVTKDFTGIPQLAAQIGALTAHASLLLKPVRALIAFAQDTDSDFPIRRSAP
jgi:hypothetical protein